MAHLKTSALVGLITLALYLLTVSPSIPPGYDSGELISACAAGGIAHPPGYPLYTCLGFLLCKISPLSPALTMNLFSVICSSLASFLLCLSLSIVIKNDWISALSTLLFTVALTPWRMAVGAEVFAFHLFFCASIFCFSVLWKYFPSKRRLWGDLLVLTVGLACSHHHTIILIIPGLVLFIWLSKGKEKIFYPEQILLFILGLLPYIWLPLRSAYLDKIGPVGTALNWGRPHTWENFWWVVTRKGYGTFRLSVNTDVKPMACLINWFLSLVTKQFFFIACCLGFYGLYKSWREYRAEFFLFAGLFIFSGPVWSLIAAQPYDNPFIPEMLERFYAASDLAFTFFIAVGSVAFCKSKKLNKLIYATLVVSCLFNLIYNFDGASEHKDYLLEKTANFMCQDLKEGDIIFTSSDVTAGMVIYKRTIDNANYIHVPCGDYNQDWFIESLPENYRNILRYKGPIFLVDYILQQGGNVYFEDARKAVDFGFADSNKEKHYVVSDGLLWRYMRKDENIFSSQEDLREHQRSETVKISNFIKENNVDLNYDESRPFWHRFAVKYWLQALKSNSEDISSEHVYNKEYEYFHAKTSNNAK